jgi:hypothetical protein
MFFYDHDLWETTLKLRSQVVLGLERLFLADEQSLIPRQ